MLCYGSHFYMIAHHGTPNGGDPHRCTVTRLFMVLTTAATVSVATRVLTTAW